MKSQNNGKLLVWFADRVYLLKKDFDLPVGGSFEEKLPEIVGLVHELRNTNPKAKSVYGKINGMDKCLKDLDKALYEADKLAYACQELKEMKEVCRCQLEDVARRLAEIWWEEYNNPEAKQTKLIAYICQ